MVRGITMTPPATIHLSVRCQGLTLPLVLITRLSVLLRDPVVPMYAATRSLGPVPDRQRMSEAIHLWVFSREVPTQTVSRTLSSATTRGLAMLPAAITHRSATLPALVR